MRVTGSAPLPALVALLRQHRDALAERWVADILASYPGEAAAVFGREHDRFANPVGHSVRTGVTGLLAALCDGMDQAQIHDALREIIQVRAVQQFTPGQAVGFVFRLKPLVRAELGATAREPRVAAELAGLDTAIDRLALLAFEIFTECREEVYRLRLAEAQRRVEWIVDRLNARSASREARP